MKNFERFTNSPRTLLILAFILNLTGFLVGYFLMPYFTLYYFGLSIVCAIVFTFVFAKKIKPNKLKTVILITILAPLVGGSFIIVVLNEQGDSKVKKQWLDLLYYSTSSLPQDTKTLDELAEKSTTYSRLSNFILNSTNMPVYDNSICTYFSTTEKYFSDLYDNLRGAKKYIFIELYKVDDGVLWQELFDILRLKARDGIEIRLLYDEYGCRRAFSGAFRIFDKLENHSIHVCAFNKIKPFKYFSRNRSRRNSVCIDGKTCYLSCFNYIDDVTHSTNMFASYQDCGIKYVGEACWNNTVMFLNSWKFSTRFDTPFENYKPTYRTIDKSVCEFIQPFDVNPTSTKVSTKDIILNTIATATKSLYISCPYLILDEDLKEALIRSAKSGVDIRIMYPANPVDKAQYYLARETFYDLAKYGAKLYEHTTAHLHSKVFIVDKTSVLIGNLNLVKHSSPRSFDNGVYIHNSSQINTIVKDFEKTLETSRMLSTKELKKRTFRERIVCWAYKFFSL